MLVRIRVKPKMRAKLHGKHMPCGGHKVTHEWTEASIKEENLTGKGPKHWLEWEEIDEISEPKDLRDSNPTEALAAMKMPEVLELVEAASDEEELRELRKHESAGKNRKGVINAIEERINTIENPEVADSL